jgi:hypothetical protein
MHVIDFILNIAGLLLWVSWRAIHLTPIGRPGTSLVATLRHTAPPRSRWIYLLALVGLLMFRAVVYWQLAPAILWTPRILLGLVAIPFRNNLPMFFGYMTLYSFLSFGLILLLFYVCLLVLSCLNSNLPENDPYHRFVQLHLGFVEAFPKTIKLLLPFVISILLWYLLYQLLVSVKMATPTKTILLIGQGTLLGLALYAQLINLALFILCLYLIDSYVFVGNFLFLEFIHGTGDNLLRPIRQHWLPLCLGKIDLAAPMAIALLIVIPNLYAMFATRYGWSLEALFRRLSY